MESYNQEQEAVERYPKLKKLSFLGTVVVVQSESSVLLTVKYYLQPSIFFNRI